MAQLLFAVWSHTCRSCLYLFSCPTGRWRIGSNPDKNKASLRTKYHHIGRWPNEVKEWEGYFDGDFHSEQVMVTSDPQSADDDSSSLECKPSTHIHKRPDVKQQQLNRDRTIEVHENPGDPTSRIRTKYKNGSEWHIDYDDSGNEYMYSFSTPDDKRRLAITDAIMVRYLPMAGEDGSPLLIPKDGSYEVHCSMSARSVPFSAGSPCGPKTLRLSLIHI